MAKQNYDASLRRLLLHEGGFSNHPADPGGPTNFGITIYDYRKYVKPGATAADVEAMQVEEAKRIYRAKYWDAQRCDDLPAGVDDCVFDYGVNSGIGRSGKVLRRVLGLPDNDWHTSDAVLAALGKRDAKAVIDAICDERLKFLRSLRTWPVFGKGWSARVVEVREFALRLADHPVQATSERQPTPTPSADLQAGKGVVPLHPAAKIVVRHGGAIAAAAGGAGAWDWIAHHAAAAAAIVGAGTVLIGGAIYAVNRWHRSQQEAVTPGAQPVPAAN